MKKVLLLGKIIGSYRAQYITEYLGNKYLEYSFAYIDHSIFEIRGRTFKKKLVRRVANFIQRYIYFLIIPFVDVVFYLPINYGYQSQIKWAKFFNKKVITDFYVSSYVIYTENKKVGKYEIKDTESTVRLNSDKYLLEHSDTLIFLNKDESELFSEKVKYDISNKDSYYFPVATPERRLAKLSGLKGEKNTINIGWWGKASALHGFTIMEDAIKLIHKDYGDKYLFTFFEVSKERAEILMQRFRDIGIDEITEVKSNLSFNDDLEEYIINNCDMALGSFGDTDMAKTVITNKVVDAISMGIPTVTQEAKAVSSYKLDEDIVFTTTLNPVEVADKILEVSNASFDIVEFQNRCHEVHRSTFSKQALFRNLELIL